MKLHSSFATIAIAFIVSWTANYTSVGSCPEERPVMPAVEPNPYTGVYDLGIFGAPGMTSIVTAEMKYCPHHEKREKQFEAREEAEAFIAGCPEGTCTDVAITEAPADAQ